MLLFDSPSSKKKPIACYKLGLEEFIIMKKVFSRFSFYINYPAPHIHTKIPQDYSNCLIPSPILNRLQTKQQPASVTHPKRLQT